MRSNDNIIKKMKDVGKQQLLYNQKFIEKYQLTNYELADIISSLKEETKSKILIDKDLIVNKLHLTNSQITDLAKELLNEEIKYEILKIYELDDYLKIDIIDTFSNKRKLDILLEEKSFDKYYKMKILKSLDVETLSEFLANNKEFCSANGINPYEIVNALNKEQQIEFVTKLEKMDLSLNQKREILALLAVEVKQSIDISNFPEEYKTAISMQTVEDTEKIILDLERELEDYRGLDNLIRVNPEEFTEEQRTKFMKLCDICPNMQVVSTLNNMAEYSSTANEYKEDEEWINSIIDSLNPEYSKAQKMAIIDNAIGKKISYSPDFGTEVFDENGNRAIWRIISSGYGVCNGIARIEQYIFKRIGIESEIVKGVKHVFLKIKDIELPLAKGEIAKGNTILDPTWNLASHRFGGRPRNFCISYEQARKNDIDAEHKDHNCHKNDEKLQDATLNLDEQSLRMLFTSVGLADKNGQFPLADLIEKSKLLDEIYRDEPNQNINKQFLLLSKTCPEFATCQNSSMGILRDILLDNKNLKFNKCVVNRVYNRTDKEKRPILFVYIDSKELANRFYLANKDIEQFVELPQEEFIKQFECYDEDLKKNKRT